MSAAAQRDEPTGTEAAPLRQLAAERLAAHRNRRAAVLAPDTAKVEARIAQAAVRLQARRDAAQSSGQTGGQTGGQTSGQNAARPSVRDAVAARYNQSPSYQEFLAAEAERALEKAQAAAEVAARNALAVAEAQRQLLDEIDQWNQPPEALFVVEPGTPEMWEPRKPAPRLRQHSAEAAHAEPVTPAELKIQLFAEMPPTTATATLAQPRPTHFDSEELAELDQEIAFRLAPEFAEHRIETQPIQANIIEFPRQLVATRKARPRLAEGPLREDGTPEPQLRIFEVEPEQVSTAPESAPTAAPEWQSLLLSPSPAAHLRNDAPSAEEALDAARNIAQAASLHAAPVSRRAMAMAVDAVCLGAGFTAFTALAVRLCGSSLQEVPRPVLGVTAAVALMVFIALYQMLFFCFNEATPGMVYARLGLCTFADANPSRSAVRRRLLATVVAVSPLGLGLLWMLLDTDRMGWHDRISRMYPRAY